MEAARLDSKGHFELLAPKPGKYWISFHQNSVMDSLSEITGTVELKLGSNSWSLDIPVGSTRIENLDSMPDSEELAPGPGTGAEVVYELRWKGKNGMEWVFRKWAGQDGTWELPVVAARAIKILRYGPLREPRSSIWGEGITIHLRAGENRQTRLP